MEKTKEDKKMRQELNFDFIWENQHNMTVGDLKKLTEEIKEQNFAFDKHNLYKH